MHWGGLYVAREPLPSAFPLRKADPGAAFNQQEGATVMLIKGRAVNWRKVWLWILDLIVFGLALVGAWVLLSGPAHAEEGPTYFADVGLAEWEAPANTVWWQDGYDHSLQMNDLFIRAGAVEMITPQLGASLSAYSLGGYRIHALATDNEPCYFAIGASPSCGMMRDYRTSGDAFGVAFTGLLHPFANGFYVEAGPTYYWQDFHIDKSDGFRFRGHESGVGFFEGVGFRGKSSGVSLSLHKGSVDNDFADGVYPTGTGRVWMFATRAVL
jgi:hypothetical protein